MNEIAERYAEREIGPYFLSAHEAHPGEIVPHLTAFEQKLKHAMMLWDELGVEQRREGQRLAPFYVQRLGFRLQDRGAFYQGLERNGPKAVEEFRKAFGE